MVVQGETVKVGSRVRVRDADGEDEFTIVPESEADASAERVSVESPFGRALLGHKIGEEVTVRAPGGTMGVTVVAID